MENNKTVKNIDTWFNSECKQALKEVPQGIKDIARKNHDYTKQIAESIARKKCFTVDAVMNYLTSLI